MRTDTQAAAKHNLRAGLMDYFRNEVRITREHGYRCVTNRKGFTN